MWELCPPSARGPGAAQLGSLVLQAVRGCSNWAEQEAHMRVDRTRSTPLHLPGPVILRGLTWNAGPRATAIWESL